jgi:hypothetical protein
MARDILQAVLCTVQRSSEIGPTRAFRRGDLAEAPDRERDVKDLTYSASSWVPA